jgi:HPt (histidine-containing phosphotransfer) domain-containing protein
MALRRGGYLISFHASIDRTVFDAELLADVQRLIPPERLREYLRELDRQLQLLVEAASSDESLAQRAHKIVSQAGMLGLNRMSQCARALEDACRTGEGQAAAQSQCRAAIGDIEQYAMPAAALPPEAKTANG